MINHPELFVNDKKLWYVYFKCDSNGIIVRYESKYPDNPNINIDDTLLVVTGDRYRVLHIEDVTDEDVKYLEHFRPKIITGVMI